MGKFIGKMNLLYFADPNSTHDIKWINYFASNKRLKTYILPRKIHAKKIFGTSQKLNSVILNPIPNFSIIRFYITFYTAWQIKQTIKNYDIKIIHILYAEPNGLWCLFRRYFNIPMIISSRGTDVLLTIPDTFKRRNLINIIVSFAYKKAFQYADIITGTSESQLTSIRKFSNREDSLRLLRTGVELNKIISDTRSFCPQEVMNTSFLLFPRYIKPLYNHEFCLEAITLLPENIKKSYSMVFIGKNSGDLNYQRQLEAKMKEIKDVNFIFLPNLSQEGIFETYKRASLIVMTPKSDGTPVTAMEALVLDKPLILGPIPYDRDIFDDNVIKLKEWSPFELAQKICLVLKNSPKSFNFSQKGNIDLEKNMEKLYELYKSVSD